MMKKYSPNLEKLIIRASEPDVHYHQNVLFVPKRYNFDEMVGLYTDVGYLIPQAALFHKYPPEMKGHRNISPLDMNFDYPKYDDAFYVGHIDLHYGHTITEFVSRLWAIKNYRRSGQKLLYHSIHNHEYVFSCRWFLQLLHLFGLQKDDFISFYLPTKISRVTVPSPAFGENNYVYKIFSDFCSQIGEKINVDSAFEKGSEFIWLSRDKVEKGTFRLKNESALCDTLKNKGFRIVHPEFLSIVEQISLFKSNVVCGLLGSAFHTSIFQKRSKIIALTATQPSENFILMDTVSETDATYLQYETSCEENIEGFYNTASCKNHEEIAVELQKLCQEKLVFIEEDKADRCSKIKIFIGPEIKKIDERFGKIEYNIESDIQPEYGSNILKIENIISKTSQSSTCLWSRYPEIERDSFSIIENPKDKTSYCHTGEENNPFWEVYFSSPCDIYKISIYNRIDSAFLACRANRLTIELKELGEWKAAFNYESYLPFGGLDGFPLIWVPEVAVRGVTAVRLKIIGKTFLHLSHVKIFGKKTVIPG